MQNKIVILVLSGLILATILHAGCISDENKKDNIYIENDTTWTLGESPYSFDKNVVVDNSATLTIEPGVEVKFKEYNEDSHNVKPRGLEVQGKLIAEGTEANPIVFTYGGSDLYWKGIDIDHYSSGNRIQHCIIEYANVGLTLRNENNFVEDNIFRHNRIGAALPRNHIVLRNNILEFNACGVYLSYIATVTSNIIRDNTRSGIECRGEYGDGPVIDGNIIVNNTGNGIDAQQSGLQLIANNTISGNGGSGIYIDQDTFPDIEYNEIINNGQHGIDVQGARANIYDNNISGNAECGVSVQGFEAEVVVDEGGGSDGSARHYDAKVNLVLNEISYNKIGVLSIESEVDISSCNLVDNTEWAVKNDGTVTIDATDNWWGTAAEAAIAAMIEGDVIFEPWLEEPRRGRG